MAQDSLLQNFGKRDCNQDLYSVAFLEDGRWDYIEQGDHGAASKDTRGEIVLFSGFVGLLLCKTRGLS